MPAKKAVKPSTVEWVDMSLSVAESARMKEQYAEIDAILADIEKLLDSGYKLTLTADDYNDAFAAFIIPKGDDHVNKGKILAARGSDWAKAARGALFRHYVLFDGDAWTDHQKQVIDSD